MPHINRLTFGRTAEAQSGRPQQIGNHAEAINAVEHLLSVSDSIETRRHDEFEARSKPIGGDDDAEMGDELDPTPEEMERVEREAVRLKGSGTKCCVLLRTPGVARPSSLERLDQVVVLFVRKRSPRSKKKSAFARSQGRRNVA